MIGAAYALGQFTSHEWVGEIDVPTAVVVTLRDQLVSPSRQRKLARAIPGATVHCADTDHAACVLGARAFIPALVEACGSVGDRLGDARRVA
jgi:pimeloyl-ACP methyl ester carboxylesterase